MAEEELTEEQLVEKLAGVIPPMPEDKDNVHTFLKKVVQSQDTIKTGFLDEEELGKPSHPVRTYKELELFCSDIANMDYFAEYFRKKAEIQTSTSLSREAKLLELAVVQRREIADVTKNNVPKKNKGWFKPKAPPQPQQPQPMAY